MVVVWVSGRAQASSTVDGELCQGLVRQNDGRCLGSTVELCRAGPGQAGEERPTSVKLTVPWYSRVYA